MAVALATVLKQRFFDDNGEPLSNGKLYSYQAGTTTPQATYTDQGGLTANTNPVVLDSYGEADVWLDTALSYKFVLKDSDDATRWTVDNVVGQAFTDSIATAAIQNGAVTTAKLADDAVTAAKLADDASTDSNRAVTTDHIRDGAVTPVKISDTLKMSGQRVINLGLAAATTTNSADSIKIQGATATLSSSNVLYVSIMDTDNPGLMKTLSATTDVTIDLTGATWGWSADDLTDYTLYVYAINDAGTLKWGVSPRKNMDIVLNADDSTSTSSITSYEKVLVDSALTGDSYCELVGYFKANYDFSGGAASNLWEIQSGVGDILLGRPKMVQKWMSRLLTADVTSDGTMGDLTFAQLEVGRVYEFKLQAHLFSNTGDQVATVNVVHDGTTIGSIVRIGDSGSGTNGKVGISGIFLATATTLTFVAASASATSYISGNNDRNKTYVQLVERNDLDANETVQWEPT